MWSDPIADMLTRIRNSARVRKAQATIPCSKMKIGIAKVLEAEGFISGYDVIEDTKQNILSNSWNHWQWTCHGRGVSYHSACGTQ